VGSEEFMKNDIKIVEISESWMYLTNEKTIAYEMFENWILFFLYYIPAAMFFSGFVSNAASLRGVGLLIPIALMIIIKRKVEKLSLFIGANLLVLVAVLLISPSILEKVFLTLIAAAYFIHCFKQRYDEVVRFLNLLGLLLCGPLLAFYYIVADYFNLQFIKQFIMFAAINTVVCYSIYLHKTRTQKLLEWEKGYALTFSSKVKRIKLATSALIVTIIGLLNLFFWKSGMFALFDYIQDRIGNFFRFTNESKPMPKPTQAPQGSQENMSDIMQKLGGDDKPNIILLILWKFLEIVLTIMVIVILAYVIWLAYLKLKEMYKLFYYKEEKGNEKREVILPTEFFSKEISSRIRNMKNNIEEILENSNRKKIRRIYNKIIVKYKRKGVDIYASNTPYELQLKISKHSNSNLEKATSIYEKARYSTEQCSDEDVEIMKKYL
jgi:hypothetical protein